MFNVMKKYRLHLSFKSKETGRVSRSPCLKPTAVFPQTSCMAQLRFCQTFCNLADILSHQFHFKIMEIIALYSQSSTAVTTAKQTFCLPGELCCRENHSDYLCATMRFLYFSVDTLIIRKARFSSIYIASG